MCSGELRLLQAADVVLAEEGVHLRAEVPQTLAAVTRRPLGDELGHRVVQERVVVVQPLEGDQRRDQSSGLARFNARGQQEEQRIEVVLLGDHAVLAQVLRHHRGGNAVRLIFPALAVEPRRQQGELGRIGDGEALLQRLEAVPGLSGRQRPIARVAGEQVGRHGLPGHVVRAAVLRRVADRHAVGHERIEEPAPRRITYSSQTPSAFLTPIEFNDRFRYSDVASDVAFLAMDLDFQKRSDLANYFIEKYLGTLKTTSSQNSSILQVLQCLCSR